MQPFGQANRPWLRLRVNPALGRQFADPLPRRYRRAALREPATRPFILRNSAHWWQPSSQVCSYRRGSRLARACARSWPKEMEWVQLRPYGKLSTSACLIYGKTYIARWSSSSSVRRCGLKARRSDASRDSGSGRGAAIHHPLKSGMRLQKAMPLTSRSEWPLHESREPWGDSVCENIASPVIFHG